MTEDRKSHKTMTPDEYSAMPIIGWHEVCRDVDGFDGVGVRFLGAPQPLGVAQQPTARVIPDEESAGKTATRLLDQWSEIQGAVLCAPYQETMAFLGKPNSAGWVWSHEVRFERDFDKDAARQRGLALQCVADAEQRAELLTDRLTDAQRIIAEYQASTIAAAKADVAAHGLPIDRNAVIEECAKVCEDLRHEDYSCETSEWSGGTFDCARAIRALCGACGGTGRTDNHVTGEIECPNCQGSGDEDTLAEGIEILVNLIDSIQRHGNYSPEATVTFIEQSLQCFREARTSPVTSTHCPPLNKKSRCPACNLLNACSETGCPNALSSTDLGAAK